MPTPASEVEQSCIQQDDVYKPSNEDEISEEPVSPEEWLEMISDDELDDSSPSVGEIVNKLLKSARRHKSFIALYKLQAVKNYLELTLKYLRNPRVKNPRTRASLAIATAVGKGPYFARKIRHLALYIKKFHTLPPTNSGKHHAHPSLLNNERVAQAVRRYLTVVANGEVRLFPLFNKYESTFSNLFFKRSHHYCCSVKSIW